MVFLFWYYMAILPHNNIMQNADIKNNTIGQKLDILLDIFIS